MEEDALLATRFSATFHLSTLDHHHDAHAKNIIERSVDLRIHNGMMCSKELEHIHHTPASQAQGRSPSPYQLIGANRYSENLLSTTASRQVRF